VGDGEGDVEGASATWTEAVPETEPGVVPPLATPVAVAARVTESPAGALFGTASRVCSSMVRFACSAPSLQVCVPSPLPQTVKEGAGKLLGLAEICTLTWSAAPPVDQTSILYCAACPGCTFFVVACTLRQSWVAVEEGELTAAPQEAPPPGLRLGLRLGEGLVGGEVGAAGSARHTLVA
jgi:hypothetical protein